ncbi:hypothetical protein BJY04DRAFT_199338 [Aspergillus karnatakaensis]|uniref:hybrid sensor histidine kinase/response regulator n=1 Tax=Aspergillus karnatakaensis TaxID=1810916 RepID=UPI003CCE0F2E
MPAASFLPKADAAILTSRYRPPRYPPREQLTTLDPDRLDEPISACKPEDIDSKFYPPKAPNAVTHTVWNKPPDFDDRYLRAFLAHNERLRLSMLWYYTRDVLKQDELLSGLQQKVRLAQESTGWEFAVIGILDIDVYIRLATVNLELGNLPRGETICAHTVTQPPGSVFHLPTLQEDWRFRKCPYLEQGGLYAYAGVPLRLQHESGECVGLGSLCVASSKAEDPITKDQEQALVRLADWIVSDLILAARARRQRERHQMAELLSSAQSELDKVVSEEPVFRILRSTYPNAIIKLQPAKATYIDLGGRNPILVSDLEGGLWEDTEYLDALIAEKNHEPLPTTKTVRIIAAPCESVSGASLLMVGVKDFHAIFDDVDMWFVETCAGLISQMFRKRLLYDALRAKEKFLRGFSHQARTPIHGILASVDLLAEELQALGSGESGSIAPSSVGKATHPGSYEQSKYLNIIKMGGRDLVSIINNMITLNRWTDIAMTDRHYATHPVLRLETELSTGIINLTLGDTRYQSSIFFTHVLPPGCEEFWMDIDVLRDSLLPILYNAVQHTPDGIVSVKTSINPSLNQLTVDIIDNGRGIHQEDHRRIFDLYEKVDLYSARAGLGLTLASRFAALLHGSVALISSSLNHGSHFRATFRDVEFSCPSRPRDPLLPTRQNLPSRFFCLASDPSSISLSSHFAGLLTENGFAQSDVVEDAFVIFDVATLEQHRLQLSRVPSGAVAICLLPGLDAEPPFEPANNVVYASGPFSSSSLGSILEEAESRLLEINSAQPPVAPSEVVLPILLKVSETIAASSDESSAATVSSESEPGIATPAESDESIPIPRGLSTSTKPTTLIVDDNTVNLRVMEMYCKKRGLPYETAKDGRQAVDVFLKRQSSATADTPPIELIFMDLQMPVCDGIEATREIRALELKNNWERSLVLVMTGQDTIADKTAAKQAGGDEYFVKPVVIQQLDRVIKRHFPAFTDKK